MKKKIQDFLFFDDKKIGFFVIKSYKMQKKKSKIYVQTSKIRFLAKKHHKMKKTVLFCHKKLQYEKSNKKSMIFNEKIIKLRKNLIFHYKKW
jgi:hypothetical protein